ncbi:MAG: diguanylate cyclase, partial [Anaerolineales bacterium]|nr:diguanylate cyclase [Anaerolineales bacterium]
MGTWQFTPYATLYLAATMISFFLAYLGWRMQPVQGTKTFSLMAFSSGLWSLGYLLGFFNTDPAWKLLMLRVEYLGIIGADFFWLLFAASYANFKHRISRRLIILLAIVPAITLLQVLLIQGHTFFYRSFEFSTIGDLIIFNKVYGPGFYLWVGYAYLVTLAGVVMLILGMINMPEKYRFQFIPLILVIVSIISPNILYILGANPIAPYDPTSLMFMIAGILLLITIRYLRFLDIVPVAHHLVFENVESGVIIIDERSYIQEMNPAAERVLSLNQDNVLGKSIREVLPKYQEILKRVQDSSETRAEIRIDDEYFEIQSTPITDQGGASQGRIIMFYDITARKQAEYELRLQAITDPLTGVLNRRQFFSLARPTFQQAKRYQRHLTTLMIDLDYFKQVNDQHGHIIGDQVLVSLAERLQEHTRTSDILARYGGEEFVILMPETDIESALTMAERLRIQVHENPIETDVGPVPLTISIG